MLCAQREEMYLGLNLQGRCLNDRLMLLEITGMFDVELAIHELIINIRAV